MSRKIRVTFPWILMMVFITGVTVVAFFPFWSMIVMGTYETTYLYDGIKIWFGPAFQTNLKKLADLPLLTNYRNSFFVSFASTAICLTSTSMAGYAFGKYRFRFRKPLFNFILMTMMVPGQLGLIAFIIEMRDLKWIDTLLPLIIPAGASSFGVFWMTQFIASAIPNEIIESARIDGCSEFKTFLRVSLPFIRPAFMTLGLLQFLWSWNSFLTPMLILESAEKFTVPLGIRQLQRAFDVDTAAIIFATSFATIPILVLFSAFNRTLITGLTSGAVKG